MPLLRIAAGKTLEKITSRSVELERHIQRLIEQNLKEALDIDFVASEFCIQGGRMDTLGIDSSDSPVILEYKKGGNASVISQAAYYFTWLNDHKADFEKLTHKVFPDRRINWEGARLICMAETFNFYDYSAIKVLSVRMELPKYRFYGDDLLYITPDRPVDIEERLTGKAVTTSASSAPISALSFDEFLMSIASDETRTLFGTMRETVHALSSDVQEKVNPTGVSFRTSMLFCDTYPRKGGKVGVTVYFPNRLLTPEIVQKHGLKQGKNWATLVVEDKDQLETFREIAQGTFLASQ